jgi:peptide subunit release factor 1 (eRF1)
VAFHDSFTVADTPRLRPLVEALAAAPRAVVLFVDGESARFITLTQEGVAEEVTLETTDVVGHHRRGGWAMLLQSRYQRHLQVHRARHFEAVAEALAAMIEQAALPAVVLAGEPRNLAVFRTHVPSRLTERIVGTIAGARYETSSVFARRALDLVRHLASGEMASALDTVLAEAGGGGRAAAGVDATVEAVNRGTAERLYLLERFEEAGRVCSACGALQRAPSNACRWCAKPTLSIELGEAMVRRVIAGGGAVESVSVHAGLDRAGGVAARLRYAPASAPARARV